MINTLVFGRKIFLWKRCWTILISVIVPVYNTAPYLPCCVDSILGQTYKKIEVILVDDGSSDESGYICDAYAEKDARVRVVYQPNGGVSKARNAGLRLAVGDYICFVDSDDWLEEDYFSSATKVLFEKQASLINNFVLDCGDHKPYAIHHAVCVGGGNFWAAALFVK